MSLIENTPPATASFEEQLRAAEQEAGVPEYYGPDAPEETPEPEPVVEATPVAEEPETVEAVEETPAEKADPPDQLAELNKKLGQIINENADLKREVSRLSEAREPEPQPQQQYPLTPESLSYFDEFAMENPMQAVATAVQQQNPILYQRAMSAWKAQDPDAADYYQRQADYAQLRREIEQQFQPQIAAVQEVASRQQFEDSLGTLGTAHPDFGEVIGTVTPEKAEEILDNAYGRDVVKQIIGTPDGNTRLMTTLYHYVKAEQANTFAQAADTVAQKAKDEAAEAKREATVASASTTTPDQVPVSEEERMRLAWNERPSMRDAWENRSPSRT